MRPAIRSSPVTVILIAASVALTAVAYFGHSEWMFRLLLISDPDSSGLQDVRNGEVWRLATPMFLHFGVLHLLFNMMWMWDLGRLIEARRGSDFYAAFVLVLAVGSDLLQYWVTGSPFFGGMSGVVYGLLGYVWGQSAGRSDLGFALNRNTVIMMFGWYVLCWTGILGPIANWAHTGGLIAGIAWGYLSAVMRR